jgi:protein-L-isoaspartate(D-aspartate) O-methyltransferase
MNIEQARFNMIEQQIRPWNVLDQEILDLLFVVKREQFVQSAYQNLAFADVEIPLPGGQAMFAPKFEARILQELGVKKHETVLEIGTGSGYMAALLAHRGAKVTSVEINEENKSFAQKNLTRAGIGNVTVELGNGTEGWGAGKGQGATYDVIVISGALEMLPDEILKQVKVGGRIAAIVGQPPVMEACIITRTGENSYNTIKVFETNMPYLVGAPVPSHFTF